jgi:hypothetical protein
MECRDAQFYLRFRRPGSDELGPEVAGDLDRHLAGCDHCTAEARTASAFDTTVATAMQDVPVPAGLRNKLVAHVAEKRGAELRRKAYRYAGAAAVVFLALGLSFGLFGRRPSLDTYADLVAPTDEQVQDPKAAIRNWLAAEGLPAVLPQPFDPKLLDSTTYERVKGKNVPVIKYYDRNGPPGFAKVYILRVDGQFADVEDLKEAVASNCQAQVFKNVERARGFVYVVVYTGPDLGRFLTADNRVALD